MARQGLVDPLPERDEAEDLLGLLAFADVGVGIAKGPTLGILCKKDEDTGLAPAPRGDVVSLEDWMLRSSVCVL